MRQRPYRNPVHSRLGDRANSIQRDTPRCLGYGSPLDELDRLAEIRQPHVVEHDHIGPRIDRDSHLIYPVAFDLNLDTGRADRTRAFDRQRDVSIATLDGQPVIDLSRETAVDPHASVFVLDIGPAEARPL